MEKTKKTNFMSTGEISKIGFKKYGKDLQISKDVKFYFPELMILGDNIRIDDFSILSGRITLGSNIHISSYCCLFGAKGITFENNTGCSTRTTIYSEIDDFKEGLEIGVKSKQRLRKLISGHVIIKENSQIGAHCVVFPNIIIGKNVRIGACSLINKSIMISGVYYGIPAK